ncbi:MAG: flagellar protein FlaG [Desulfobacterales bacterium]
MLVEPVTESGKGMALSTQAKLPAGQETVQKDSGGLKSAQMPNLAELSEMASDIQKNLNIIHNVNLQFTVYKDSGQIMITVKDEETGKVIREIPPSEFIEFSKKFGEMVGMIFDRKG